MKKIGYILAVSLITLILTRIGIAQTCPTPVNKCIAECGKSCDYYVFTQHEETLKNDGTVSVANNATDICEKVSSIRMDKDKKIMVEYITWRSFEKKTLPAVVCFNSELKVLFNVSSTDSAVTVRWDAMNGAKKYKVKIIPGKTEETTELEKTFKGLKKATSYIVDIQACNATVCTKASSKTITTQK